MPKELKQEHKTALILNDVVESLQTLKESCDELVSMDLSTGEKMLVTDVFGEVSRVAMPSVIKSLHNINNCFLGVKK